jgi:hypothetical protein
VKNVTLPEQREAVSRAVMIADEKISTPATAVIVCSASTGTYPYSAVYLAGSDYESFLRGASEKTYGRAGSDLNSERFREQAS